MSTEVATMDAKKTEVQLSNGDIIPLTITGNAELDIQNFTTNEAEIKKMEDQFLQLKITSLEEKEKYREIYESRQLVRKSRLSVDKIADALNEGAKSYVKRVDARKKELIEKLKPIELHLKSQEEVYEQLKAEKALELERQAEELLTARASLLIDLGCAFTGKFYQIEQISIEHNKLADYSEKEWNTLLDEIKPIAERIKAEEEERKAEAERMRIELEKEKERQAQRDSRVKQLVGIGLIYDGENFTFEDVNVHNSELIVLNESEWNVLIERIAPVVLERKAQIEAEKNELARQEAERKEAHNKLNAVRREVASALGVDASLMDLASLSDDIFNAQVESWKVQLEQRKREELHKIRFDAITHLLNFVEPHEKSNSLNELSEEEFTQFKSELEKRKVEFDEATAKLKREKEEREAEERRIEAEKKAAAIAPDKEKLAALASTIRAIELPILTSVNGTHIHESILEQKEKFAVWVESKVNSL